MTKGYLVLAQGSYIKQAENLAKSIKSTQSKISNISVITDQPADAALFDYIIPIPENDLALDKQWKIHNRVYFNDLTPYTQTVVLDADMLFLSDVSHWWDLFNHYDLLVTDKVKTYRDRLVINSPYRKTFQGNNLPDLYSAFTYFRKDSEIVNDFFAVLKSVISNWDFWLDRFAPEYRQRFESIDLAMAISAKVLGIEEQIVSKFNFPNFIHMKPGCQGWKDKTISDKWSDTIGFYKTDNGIKIGAFLQSGILHYVEKDII
jgi:hypothetical protein